MMKKGSVFLLYHPADSYTYTEIFMEVEKGLLDGNFSLQTGSFPLL